ncbi:glucans biosynthesis glucosyltransferase MdoH [Xylophilus rhododendri]|uniref:Glucans biosynthesis glucosyltransferase H n=1 Tax=Xylophilus rhododendri TaxID=2697032 RepID=A0A857J7Y9_9BURK|nr:glucans biosynthesis glucosyltransferase MdoH [Xylophilus rhododendri]QHI99827.1 glucans biosynthesis glucosyltransferase MdoH [Xylophilus rhododendri]
MRIQNATPFRRPRAARSLLREERHPNAVTAPPVNRGSMAPLPWRGFWNSVGAVLLSAVTRRRSTPTPLELERKSPEAWQRAANARRLTFLLLTIVTTAIATTLFAGVQPDYDSAWLQYGQIALFAVLSAWVVTGFTTALMGFWVSLRGDAHTLSSKEVQGHAMNPDARTAIIMPICNEDVSTVFAGLRATCESVAATGNSKVFDVFVLSDSYKPEIISAERAAWEDLRAALAANPEQPQIEVYYRLRTRRTHRKAGNVADFCRRWGKDYKYMVVLDADSVMSGDCLSTLVKLMEAHPKAGIIQTATQSIGHATLHARSQQFASRMTGRLFTLGMQFWQLGESHYWGHNAILRVEPFMKHCALAPIEGTGGMSGGIMSHDFVEAALMRRAGYQVWLVSDLAGSYEQQPPDLLSELQRDRRWCQGNMQNFRLVAEPGLHRVHRAMFLTGALSYVSAPLWLAFMTLGTALWLSGSRLVQDFNVLPGELMGLWAFTVSVLFLPRVLGIAAVLIKGEQRMFGGTWGLLKSSALESVLAILQSPVRMLAHSLFVITALTGIKLDWKSPPREANGLGWKDSAASLAPMSAVVAVLAAGIAAIDASALVWLLPVGLPLLLAIPVSVYTSHVELGSAMRSRGFLLIPEERWSPSVLRRARLHANRLSRPRLSATAAAAA